jgi:hypothetical protein
VLLVGFHREVGMLNCDMDDGMGGVLGEGLVN